MAEVKVTPLYGARTALLEVGSVRILLNCGWDASFDETQLDSLEAVVKDVDLVLLTHHGLEHLGALPRAVGRLGLTAPIYCTLPVHKMGQMTLYDAQVAMVSEHGEAFSTDKYSLDDLDAAFDKVKPLKFSQHLTLAGKGAGIELTPYSAGHTIGGAFWRIVQNGTDEIVFAIDLNHKRSVRPCAIDVENSVEPCAALRRAGTSACDDHRDRARITPPQILPVAE